LQFKRLYLALNIIKENAKSWISWCLVVYLHNEYSHHQRILLLSYLQTHELLHGSVLHIERSWQRGRKRNGNPIHGCGYTRIYYRVNIKFHRGMHMGTRIYQRYRCGYVVSPVSARTTYNFIYSNKNLTRVQNSTCGYGRGHEILSNRQFITSRYLIHPYVAQLSTIPRSCSRRVVAATDEPIPIVPDLCLFLRFVWSMKNKILSSVKRYYSHFSRVTQS